MTYYAHSDDEDQAGWHRLSEHLRETGARASSFLDPVGFGDLANAAGLLHDLGKYSREFQERLIGGPPCNHSTAGAKEAINRYGGGDARQGSIGKMLAYAIAGHHAGLADGVNGHRPLALEDRLKARTPELDPTWNREIKLPTLEPPKLKPRNREMAGFCAAFATRMVFSALVDADRLDTEAWDVGRKGETVARGGYPPLLELLARLDAYLNELGSKTDDTEVNRLRKEVLGRAREKAAEAPGLFMLTVPTGGGKTLSSLSFALKHAALHGLARVIYVIPYTSIVEQTASVFRRALGAGTNGSVDFIVEHHGTFDEERVREREGRCKLRLAMENWDAPVVVTTAVQFFESLFANRPSRCRKLHNIVNSAVVLDEAQTLPVGLLRPCVAALDELARNWRTSIVVCTATQPALREEDGFRGGLTDLREIAPDPARLHRRLARTRICRLNEVVSDGELVERLCESPQALCIVNTRQHARELYEMIRETEGSVHLSTCMCARHRSEVLATIRHRLDKRVPVRLIATSLIEAGVDVDFPVVWRAEAGLESVVQAAGRCNREGKRPVGDVFVFEPAEGEGRKPPGDIPTFAAAAREVMRRHNHPANPDAIRDYFREVYWIEGEEALDAKCILTKLRERARTFDFPFATIAHDFRMIESGMVPIVVRYPGAKGDDGTIERLLRELEHVERPGASARRLQSYIVQVPPYVRRKLIDARAVGFIREEEFGEQFAVLANDDLYRPDVGLTWEDPEFRAAEGLIF